MQILDKINQRVGRLLMEKSIIIGLIQNIAILLSFTLIYDFFWAKDENIKKISGKILAGLFIGLIAVIVMYVPWIFKSGIVFDSRSILLSISGLFFGGIPTIIAMIVAAVFRFSLGGEGVGMGVAVILTSGFIGLIWRLFFPPKKIKQPYYNILLLGLVVHISMFFCTLLLPGENILSTMKFLIFPLLLIYTPGTMLLGMLMLKRWSVWQQQKIREIDELRYRTLFENAGEAILVAEDGYIRLANKRLSDILEVPYEKILETKFTSFIHPDDREFVMSRHQDRIQNINVPKSYSFRLLVRSEKIKWIDINSVLIDWDGKPASLSFLNDVTVKREDARQLVDAKNKAEESDRLKTIFLANMSHEIRTPMNAILGFSDLLTMSDLDKTKQELYVNKIQTSGKQLLNIISDIVDTSKLEANQLNINKQNCKLYDIYKQSIEVLLNNSLYREKVNLEFQFDYPEKYQDIRVNIDPYRIQQVIDNFLNNAIKYSNSGMIVLGCDIVESEKSINIKTFVRDSGIGIPEEKKGIIFKRFRQVEENQYREGVGLGLSISKGIIDLMGGEIGFDSKQDEGSTFFFSLQLDIVEGKVTSQNNGKVKTPNLENLHVLIAEDDMISYYLIKEYLQETNARVSHALDGEVLLHMLEKEVPDILLLDINMPKKDGYACLKEMQEKGYELKIIAQTAYAMENEKERCLNSGCDGYVSKPIDPDILLLEVEQVLSNKK